MEPDATDDLLTWRRRRPVGGGDGRGGDSRRDGNALDRAAAEEASEAKAKPGEQQHRNDPDHDQCGYARSADGRADKNRLLAAWADGVCVAGGRAWRMR